MLLQSKKYKQTKGFSLVELLVVIVVLGVLASIATFSVGGLSSNAERAACESEFKIVENAIEAYNARNSEYPASVEQLAAEFLRSPTDNQTLWNATINTTTGELSVDQSICGEPDNIIASAPEPPIITNIEPGIEQLTVTFDPGNNGGAAIIRYEYTINGGGDWTSSGLNNPFTISDLTPGEEYTVQMRAVNAAGTSEPSDNSVSEPEFKPLTFLYEPAAFSTSETSQTLTPTATGGSGNYSFTTTGVLPDGVSFDSTTGVFTGPDEWNIEIAQISSGNTHTCALTTAGAVKCWGSNADGQLGDGTTTASSVPVDTEGLSSGVVSISAGVSYSCAVTESGGAKCWGRGNFGRLGDGTTETRLTPADVLTSLGGSPIEDITSIEAGDTHTCVVTNSGGVRCWGFNNDGQLGDGTTTSSLVPVDVSGLSSGVKSISLAPGHTCVVMDAGGVKCWGRNSHGRLGNNTTTDSNVPVDVLSIDGSSLIADIVSVSADGAHSCALTNSGGVQCWGLNGSGQLGNGATSDSLIPVEVSGLSSGVTSVSAGVHHTCVINASGGALCWGRGSVGRLGNGTTTNQTTPASVSDMASGVAEVSAGGAHSCSVSASGMAQCWGFNESGQLGDGSTSNKTVPVGVETLLGNAGWPSTIGVNLSDVSGSISVEVALIKE